MDETIDALAIKPDGIYMDGTFGRGGHSGQILARLGDAGRLQAIDQDPQAIKSAEKFADDSRFSIAHSRFFKPWFSFNLSKNNARNHHHTTNDMELVNLFT